MRFTCKIRRVIFKKMRLMVSSDVLQACHLKKETMTYEEKEQQLVNDCVKELREYPNVGQLTEVHSGIALTCPRNAVSWCFVKQHSCVCCTSFVHFTSTYLMLVRVSGESNSQMVTMTDELSKKSEELLRHQEEIAQLLSQIVELQHRIKEVRESKTYTWPQHF